MPNSPEQLSSAKLTDKARALQDTGAYKELIQVYKLLNKRDPEANWNVHLANAYLERAKQLAAKNMHKEALVLWDNMAALSDSPQALDLAIEWLVHTGQPGKAADYFSRLSQAQPEYRALEPLMAALILAQPQLAQSLPTDAAVRQQLEVAQNALETYCRGSSAEQMRAALQAIPFRSPYRDLRQILNALLKLEDNGGSEAVLILDRVTADSAFADLAKAARTACLPMPDMVAALKSLSPAQYAFATQLRDLDKLQLKMLKQYQSLPEPINDKTLLNFILNHAPAWENKALIQQTCLALLATYPQGRKAYEKFFGPVPALEQARLAALRAERKGDLYNAEKHWREVASLLIDKAEQGDSESALGAALVLRHVVAILLEGRPDFKDRPPPGLLKTLEFSVKLDPTDKSSYLRLAELHRKSGSAKNYQHWVAQAIQKFPNDSKVLFAAASAAKARKAFKKAVAYANQLLALDPINRQAKAVLVDAHLAHARKSILAGKPHLAHKELTAAAQLQPSSIVELNRGLLALIENRPADAEQHFQRGLEQADNALTGVLQLWVEADRLDLPIQRFKHYATSLQALEPPQLLAFMRQLNHYLDEELPLRAILDELSKPLRDSAERIDDEKTMQVVCDGWSRVPHYDLLAHYGATAWRRWPDAPLFLYYQLYGDAEGDIDRVSDDDYERLGQAADQAGHSKDIRTALRIEEFLNSGLGGGFGPPEPPPEVRRMLDKLDRLPPREQQEAMRGLIELLSAELGPPPPELMGFLDDDLGPETEYMPFDLPPLHGSPRRKKRKKKRKRK